MPNNSPINKADRAKLLREFTDLGALIAQMSEPPQSVSLTAEGNHHVADLWERCHGAALDYQWSWERPSRE